MKKLNKILLVDTLDFIDGNKYFWNQNKWHEESSGKKTHCFAGFVENHLFSGDYLYSPSRVLRYRDTPCANLANNVFSDVYELTGLNIEGCRFGFYTLYVAQAHLGLRSREAQLLFYNENTYFDLKRIVESIIDARELP